MRKAREEREISLREMAEKVGVSEAALEGWESGDIASLQLGQFLRLADELERPVEWLLCGDAWERTGDVEAEVAEFVRLLEKLSPNIRESLRRFIEVTVR
ncbi:helix-turn-helix domain-containing protein [Endothiovibrio diazotrophicus]